MKQYHLLTLLLTIGLLNLIACKDTKFEITNQEAIQDNTQQSATVTGKITNQQGEPLSGVTVVTQPFGRSVTFDSNNRKIVSSIMTDINGEYSITDLPAGTYKLLFLASGFSKVSLTLGSVDFLPNNLIEGKIRKGVVLQNFPAPINTDTPPVALFDPEEQKRMTIILTTFGIPYTSIIGNVSQLNKNTHNLLVVGLDATVFNTFEELINNKTVISTFTRAGGSIYLGQLNDFSVESTPMPFLTGDQQFILHTENAPFNDFTSGLIVDQSHPIITNIEFNNWRFVEAGQQAIKNNVTFDAAIKNSIENSPNWNVIVTTPAENFNSGAGVVTAESDVIIAEYHHPESNSRILLNQAAFYQGTFGDITDPNATRLTQNVVDYIKHLNR